MYVLYSALGCNCFPSSSVEVCSKRTTGSGVKQHGDNLVETGISTNPQPDRIDHSLVKCGTVVPFTCTGVWMLSAIFFLCSCKALGIAHSSPLHFRIIFSNAGYVTISGGNLHEDRTVEYLCHLLAPSSLQGVVPSRRDSVTQL